MDQSGRHREGIGDGEGNERDANTGAASADARRTYLSDAGKADSGSDESSEAKLAKLHGEIEALERSREAIMSRSHEIGKEEKARDLSHAASRAEDNVANLRKIQADECGFEESIEKLQSVRRWLERQIKDDLAPPLLPEYQAQRTAELQPLRDTADEITRCLESAQKTRHLEGIDSILEAEHGRATELRRESEKLNYEGHRAYVSYHDDRAEVWDLEVEIRKTKAEIVRVGGQWVEGLDAEDWERNASYAAQDAEEARGSAASWRERLQELEEDRR